MIQENNSKSNKTDQKEYNLVPRDKVSAFTQRLTKSMKEVDRDFQKKQKTSTDKAAQIILNA